MVPKHIDYFIRHWQELLPSSSSMKLKYEPDFIHITASFSVNFFGTRADQRYYFLQDVGNDDEYYLRVTIVKDRDITLGNVLCANMIVSHFSFIMKNQI